VNDLCEFFGMPHVATLDDGSRLQPASACGKPDTAVTGYSAPYNPKRPAYTTELAKWWC